MSFDPAKLYLVPLVHADKPLPQVLVLFPLETLSLPRPEPTFIYRVDHILRVGEDFNLRPPAS